MEMKLFRLVHQKVGINDLLNSLKMTVNDNLGAVNKKVFDLLNEGAEIAGKYIFLERHFYYYIKDYYNPKDDPEENYFHIRDQFTEAELEVVHSLLLARVGMVKQAINILRRSFEAAIYGSFLCTTFSSDSHYLGTTRIKAIPLCH
jgi:hypothetical protein